LVLTLSAEEQDRKRSALTAFASQRHVVDRFPLTRESLRVASSHDFGTSREARDLLYAFDDPPREEAWRQAARRAIGA
jgi:hypothetical protein